MGSHKSVPCCFVILHYMDSDLTEKCVESILKLNNLGSSQIIVVDNASTNNSAGYFKERFKRNECVHVLVNNKNEGFSVGNNIGYKYARERFSADFVIVANNDVVFAQAYFLDILYQLYGDHPFWVAGPDIYVPNRCCHQSPMWEVDKYTTEKQIRLIIEKNTRQKDLYMSHSLYSKFQYIKERVRRIPGIDIILNMRKKLFAQEGLHSRENENCVLFGACFIFDKRFVEQCETAFTPVTFMYSEEIILQLDCFLNNRSMVYFPQLYVHHLSEGSNKWWKMTYKQFCDKRGELYKKRIAADEKYIDYLSERYETKVIKA